MQNDRNDAPRDSQTTERDDDVVGRADEGADVDEFEDDENTDEFDDAEDVDEE